MSTEHGRGLDGRMVMRGRHRQSGELWLGRGHGKVEFNNEDGECEDDVVGLLERDDGWIFCL